ncbi:MAG TPA: CBS domain-containing protein [Vicinamibacterales bacterium]|nr:CBS domain-containing protein [Vicinamibacterales bacterium]
MKTIREVMQPSFLFRVSSASPVSWAVRVMTENNIGIVAVMDDHALVGVLSERDVVRRVVAQGLDPAQTKVAEVMTSDVVLGDADEDCRMAMLKMDRANIRHLPIISGGQVVSMLSVRDLMRAELADAGVEIEHLRSYLYQVPADTQKLVNW